MKTTSALLAAFAFAMGPSAMAETPNDNPVETENVGIWPTAIWHPSGRIAMGINDLGSLNYLPPSGVGQTSVQGTPSYGLRFIDVDNELSRGANAEFESTAAGCLCEGWGASYYFGDSPVLQETGRANRASGDSNVVAPSLVSSTECMNAQGPANCQYATATATLGECLVVEHDYQPSDVTDYAFNVFVKITNNCAEPITRLRYNRVMDWDIEPEAFRERVISNPGTAVDLKCLSNAGFCSGDPEEPLSTCSGPGGPVCAPTGTGEFDHGVADHGARFEFDFADITPATPLAVGESKTFTTVYGARATSAEARTDLIALGAEAYSLGVLGSDPSGLTHFFGFTGVGGGVATCSSDADCGSFCDGAFTCVNPGQPDARCEGVSRCPPTADRETFCCEDPEEKCVTCPLGTGGLRPGTCECDVDGEVPVYPCDCDSRVTASSGDDSATVTLAFGESPTVSCPDTL